MLDHHTRALAGALVGLLVAACWIAPLTAQEEPSTAPDIPPSVQRWHGPQNWQRDVSGPVLSLGETGQFDDMHLFAPCVARFDGRYRLWYSGSRGAVGQRLFRLGLALSDDGCTFERHRDNPVYAFGDGKRSIVTATLLRNTDGSPVMEQGKLRMWFAAADLHGPGGLHTLHEASSTDGVAWSAPSEAQLENIYAPTILKEDDGYRLWYVDVSSEPWKIRHARSPDGRTWSVLPEPVLSADQAWEKGRLFYPTVVKADGVYLMWYGSYWAERASTTALGFAASSDGVTWHKSPANPVLRPDPERSWESHYTTSQSVMRLDDGTWRIWYASRTRPPFVHKYFAINTAHWTGPRGR